LYLLQKRRRSWKSTCAFSVEASMNDSVLHCMRGQPGAVANGHSHATGFDTSDFNRDKEGLCGGRPIRWLIWRALIDIPSRPRGELVEVAPRSRSRPRARIPANHERLLRGKKRAEFAHAEPAKIRCLHVSTFGPCFCFRVGNVDRPREAASTRSAAHESTNSREIRPGAGQEEGWEGGHG
jgi:hypothetical protein